MNRLRTSLVALAAAAIVTGAETCTAITLRAADGGVVYGRRMGWGLSISLPG